MRFPWLVLLAIPLSACSDRESGSGAPERRVEADASRVKAFVNDERYGDCLPKESRDEMLAMMKDLKSDDGPELPRECGSSERDRAKINVTNCTNKFEDNTRSAAAAHAQACAERFPPPP